MKSIPSRFRPAHFRKTYTGNWREDDQILPEVKVGDITVLGPVRVMRKWAVGCRQQEYLLSDDVLNPRGERLYFLLKYGIISAWRRGRQYNRYLVANSCRAFWLAQEIDYRSQYRLDTHPTAYNLRLRLRSAESYNITHCIHPSIKASAKKAIAEYVKVLETENA
jgi:hypothetical protein